MTSPMHGFPRSPLVALAGLLTLGAGGLPAKDHVLTIGGGYSPAGNQVSLERNVLFFEKLLRERLPSGTPHDLYFSDGTSPDPDLQFQPEGEDVPTAYRLMAGLFGTEDDLANQYRDHTLEAVRGGSSPEELERWFQEVGAGLQAGDRLILYVTAHGGRSGQKENPFNTKIWMWNMQSIDAARLAGWLGGLPAGVEVVTVMVQCFSGGFSHLVFNDNDAGKGDHERVVCGFYATVHDREAAGCTPDVNEANYDEFSSHFWAALRGSNRLDEPVAGCDHDGDGVISFAEAHAHAVLTSRNIDIPVKTSGAFLRVHSKLGTPEDAGLLGHHTPYSEIHSRAGAVDRAVLDGLSEALGLEGEERGARAAERAEALGKELQEVEGAKKAQKKTLDGVRRVIATDIRNRWPALENKHSPGAVRLLSRPRLREAFQQAVESHPRHAEWDQLKQERAELEEKELEISKQYALVRRFVRAVENVAYEANLDAVADPAVRARYDRIRQAEAGTLAR